MGTQSPPGPGGAWGDHHPGRPPILHPSSQAPQNLGGGWGAGGWQPHWQGPPGWPGSAKALTHGAHVPARGKAIGGERGRRSPKYPGAPDTGDYRFAGGTVAWPDSPWLPAKHQKPPKPLPSPLPLPPCGNHPTAMGGLQGTRCPNRASGTISSWFLPKIWGFFF